MTTDRGETVGKRWKLGKAEVMLILFVAGLVVILEGKFHAFAFFDDLVLSAARLNGILDAPSLASRQPPGDLSSCGPRPTKYLVLKVDVERQENATALPASTCSSLSDPACVASAPLWVQTLRTVAAMNPSVIALDLDASESKYSLADLTGKLSEGSPENPDGTYAAVVALPISEGDELSVERRKKRNAWLTEACKSARVAVASADVKLSELSGDAVQFYGQRTALFDAFPPVYPALGQVARLLDAGLGAKNVTKGPGFLCHVVTHAASAARLPFVDSPKTPAEQVQRTFLEHKAASTVFSSEWINPEGLGADLRVWSIRNASDLAVLKSDGIDCVKRRVIFIGGEASETNRDVYSTVANRATPGVVVHAMAARSAERYLKTALAVNAALDLLVGYLLTFVAQHLVPPQLERHRSFSVRLFGAASRMLSPLLMLAIVLVVSWAALHVGLFLNPLVVLGGMWLHGVLDLLIERTRAPSHHGTSPAMADGKADGPACPSPLPPPSVEVRGWRKWLPRPKMANDGRWKQVDKVIYGGSLCVVALTVVYAGFLVWQRIHVQPW